MLDARSLRNLKGVHPDLVKLVHTASQLAPDTFIITEGLRTLERQKALKAAGATRTLKSRHLTGHAVDVACIVDGKIRWDWPLYDRLSKVFKKAARDLKIPIVWGGDWASFRDGPHYELDRTKYP